MRPIITALRIATPFIVCLLVTANSHAQSFLTNGLVAYYPLNGSTDDATGSGLNLTNYGAQLTADRFNVQSNAFYFNGTNNYMATATNYALPTGTTNRTLSLWAKADASITNSTGTYVVADFGSGASANKAFGLLLQTKTWAVLFDGSGQDVFSTVTVDAAWHQYVCIYSNGFAQLYIDGTQYVNQSKTTSTAIGKLIVGNNINGLGNYFVGSVSDVRIYNRALASSEVAALYSVESSQYANSGIFQAVGISNTNLAIGAKYQMQVSSDLTTWTNSGAVFTATNSTVTNFYPVNWNQLFFRLQRL